MKAHEILETFKNDGIKQEIDDGTRWCFISFEQPKRLHTIRVAFDVGVNETAVVANLLRHIEKEYRKGMLSSCLKK